jgi:2'-5' RNA ligase
MARIFVAVRLPAPVAKELAGLSERLAGRIADVKWVAEENLHFTLRFFGQLEETALARATEAARSVTEVTTGFTLELAGVGTFPDSGRPRVLWVGVEAGREELIALAGGLETAFRNAGLGSADRPFAPHLTLGRARDPNPAPRPGQPRPPAVPRQAVVEIRAALAAAALPPATFRVAEVALIESRLSRAGPTYKDREVLALRGLEGGSGRRGGVAKNTD